MFTCPRCGSHAFRSTTLPNGTIERECRGKVVEALEVPLVKDEATIPRMNAPAVVVSSAQERQKKLDEIRRQAVAEFTGVAPQTVEAPVYKHQHARACFFIWDSVDDAKYGVTQADLDPDATLQPAG